MQERKDYLPPCYHIWMGSPRGQLSDYPVAFTSSLQGKPSFED